MTPDFKTMRAQLQAELAALDKERDKFQAQLNMIDTQRKLLMGAITNLTSLSRKPGKDPKTGALTQAILAIISDESPNELRPRDIKRRLRERQIDLSVYSQPMAYIHVMLKRLLEKEQIKARALEGGGFAYRWPDGKGQSRSR
jgi:hypothetical protein